MAERCPIKCTLELHSWRRWRTFRFPCGLFSASASTLARRKGVAGGGIAEEMADGTGDGVAGCVLAA